MKYHTEKDKDCMISCIDRILKKKKREPTQNNQTHRKRNKICGYHVKKYWECDNVYDYNYS